LTGPVVRRNAITWRHHVFRNSKRLAWRFWRQRDVNGAERLADGTAPSDDSVHRRAHGDRRPGQHPRDLRLHHQILLLHSQVRDPHNFLIKRIDVTVTDKMGHSLRFWVLKPPQSEHIGQWATPHHLSDVLRGAPSWIWDYLAHSDITIYVEIHTTFLLKSPEHGLGINMGKNLNYP